MQRARDDGVYVIEAEVFTEHLVMRGKIVGEPTRDPMLVLRSLEQKQFVPVTGAALVLPDGSTRDHGALFVNRQYLDVIALTETL